MTKIIAFTHAGGSVSTLASLREHVSSPLSVQPIELPGRGVRREQRLISSRPPLIAQLCDELAPLVRAPYALFGHSLGALIAFELAHALIARGLAAPRALFVAAAEAPRERPNGFPHKAWSDRELEAELRERGGTPPEVLAHPELLELCLPIMRADFQLCEGAPARRLARLPCPLHVFAGEGDRLDAEKLLPWREETAANFSLHWFSGDHFFVRARAREVGAKLVALLQGTPYAQSVCTAASNTAS